MTAVCEEHPSMTEMLSEAAFSQVCLFPISREALSFPLTMVHGGVCERASNSQEQQKVARDATVGAMHATSTRVLFLQSA